MRSRVTFKTYVLALCAFYLLLVLVFHAQLQFPGIPVSVGDLEDLDPYTDGTKRQSKSNNDLRHGRDINQHGILYNLGSEMRKETVKPSPSAFVDFNINKKKENPMPNLEPEPRHSFCNSTQDIFQPLGTDLIIYSAYWDDRHNDFDNQNNGTYVRIMAIVKINRRPKVLCRFPKRNSDGKIISSSATVEVEAKYYEMCENHNLLYGGFILSCLYPTHLPVSPQPCSVRVVAESKLVSTDIPLRSLKPIPAQQTYGICVPPLFGSIDHNVLVEFIEMSHLLGVNKIVFYNFDVPPRILSILEHYHQRGLVSIVPWDLNKDHANQMWYHGQLVAVQDCLYRHMGAFKFLAFNDIDEFIVPHRFTQWSEMTDYLHEESRCGFQFNSAYFDRSSLSGNATYPNLVTSTNNLRTSRFSTIRTKCMVEPRKIFEKGIHHISKPILAHLETHRVDTSVAFLHHYRACVANFGMRCQDYMKDETMFTFSQTLNERVSGSLKELSLL